MASEPVEADHANPFVDRIQIGLGAAVDEVLFESTDFAEAIRVKKGEEIFGEFVAGIKGDLVESSDDLIQCGRTKARSGQGNTEGVDVTTPRDTVEESGFNEGGAAAHEGIVDDIARGGQALDEEAGQLGFKAGAVRDFVEFVGLALLGSPELVDIDRNGDVLVFGAGDTDFEFARGGTELLEGSQLVWEWCMGNR
jgi:hypothetical protein